MTQSLWNDEPSRPLQHLRVLDLTVMVPGPFVSRLLAQYGADVVKVEPLPDGDATRTVPDSSLFRLLNQGKRSIALNMRSAETAGILRALAREADVLIENYREGVLDALGLGYGDLAMENPEMVYVSMRGFSGKNSKKAGHDLNFIAASGVGEWFLENGVPNYSTLFGDMLGGAMGCALKLALQLANPDRRGMHLITSMDESFRTAFLPRAYEAFHNEQNRRPIDSGLRRWTDGKQPHSRYYQCQDGGWISLNAIQPKHWAIFCDGMGRTDWLERQHDPMLSEELVTHFASEPAAAWETRFANHDVCLFKVVSWQEHLASSLASQQLQNDPFAWAGFTPQDGLLESPELGQDTFAILTALGHSNREISDFLDRGVAWQAANSTPRSDPPTGLPLD